MNMIQTGLPYQSKCTRTVSDSSWKEAAAPRQFNQTQHLLVSTDYSVKTSKTAAKLSAPPVQHKNWEGAVFFDNLFPFGEGDQQECAPGGRTRGF